MLLECNVNLWRPKHKNISARVLYSQDFKWLRDYISRRSDRLQPTDSIALPTVYHHRCTHVYILYISGVSPPQVNSTANTGTFHALHKRTERNNSVGVPRYKPRVKGLNREATGPHMLEGAGRWPSQFRSTRASFSPRQAKLMDLTGLTLWIKL